MISPAFHGRSRRTSRMMLFNRVVGCSAGEVNAPLSMTTSVRSKVSRQASSTSVATERGLVARMVRGLGSGNLAAGRARTKNPDCGRGAMSPAFSKFQYACTTVATLTPAVRLIARTEGTRSLVRNVPDTICASIMRATFSYNSELLLGISRGWADMRISQSFGHCTGGW